MARAHRAVPTLLVATVVVAGCAGGPATEATDTAAAVAEPASTADAPSPTPEVTSAPAPFDLPRTVVYGGLATTVETAAMGNATPATVLDADPEPGGQAHVFLDVTAGWVDGYPGGSQQVQVGWYTLALADGSEVAATEVDFASAHPVRDGEPAAFTLAFPIGADDEVEGASLQIAEPGREPAVVPLSGAAPDSLWPARLDVGGDAVTSIAGGCEDGEATVTLVGGETDLDGGVDHVGERIVLNGMARAETDHVFVRLTFRTVARTGSCGGAIVDDAQYRLAVDGLPTGPLNTHVEKLDPGQGVELTFGWLVPADATLTAVVGTADGTTATFPVSLPDPAEPA